MGGVLRDRHDRLGVSLDAGGSRARGLHSMPSSSAVHAIYPSVGRDGEVGIKELACGYLAMIGSFLACVDLMG